MDTQTSVETAAPAASGVSEADQPSTTTISTVAVQAGKAKIVLAILKSHDWIRVRIQQMEPDIMEVGSTLEEAKNLRREHDELLLKLNLKQKDVTELLARADDLAVQNTSYQEVYSAMAKTLAEAWKDLNKQLEYRKMLLDQSIAFHESALQFSHRMEEAQDRFSSVGLAHDVESARHLLQQHQDLKKNILESSMMTLQEGQLLLDRIREMGVHAHVQNRHATTAACYGIEHLLELLQDRRRHLEELWLQRKIRLEQCLQLLLLDREVNKVSEWYEKVGDVYLNRKELGDSLAATHALQEEQMHFEQQAKEIQETILRLIRTADQLVHSARSDAEVVRKRLQIVDEKCENFMLRLDARRKHLALARSFFTHAQMAINKLDEIEIQLESTDLPRNSVAALAERHAYLSHSIVEAITPALHEGRTLLERVGRDDPGVQGINSMMTVLQERSQKLEEKCKARHEAGEQSQALNQFLDKYSSLNSWMTQIAASLLAQHNDMGANLSAGRDFLELHERLNEDMKSKATDIASLFATAEEIAKLGTPEATSASEKVKAFREQWQKSHTYVQQRIRLALSYVAFHKKAQQLAIQMDALEEYLRIEKLDPTQVSDTAIKHKEESFSHLNSGYSEVENKGKHFIKEATEVKADEKLDTRRAVVVVETILSHFSERKYLITEYYEHWKVHITTGKQFKTQWHQFVQDARRTIDWLVKEEKELFVPYNAGYLGRNVEEAKRLQEKVDKFGPIAKKAQEEVEKHLKTAELLSLQGDTQGQRDQLVNELLRVHTRFQARINEYQILLNMTVKFFENLRELDKLIEKTEREYAGTELPKELTTAELMLREHEASRNRIKSLINTTAEEGDEIVIRVRQQDSESVANDEVQKVLQMTKKKKVPTATLR